MAERADAAARFAALGDPRRLDLLGRIAGAGEASIRDLATGQDVTRQAITRHLQVLEGAGMVRGLRRGREHLWTVDDEGVAALQAELDDLAATWRRRLARLKLLVERED